MADIFLSYAREDLRTAKLLAVALEKQGWSVWWDRSKILPGQNINKIIKQAISEAKCLLVIWSPTANESEWVQGEANIGLRLGILVQIHIGEFDPPINFHAMHSEEFTDWNGGSEHAEFVKLKAAVTNFVGDGSLAISPVQPTETQAEVVKSSDSTSAKIIKFEPEMIEIPAGSFQMGGDRHDDEKPVHTVTFVKPFKLGKYPVTFAEYDVFVNKTGRNKPDDSGWGRGRRPVIHVSWDDAADYAAWLRKTTGQLYRLPSEAEWEYACRAASSFDFFWGDDGGLSNDYAWFKKYAGSQTQPVGQKQPNPFGLYDMVGNISEWVQDIWHDNYFGAPDNGLPWENHRYPERNKGRGRVIRGGSWRNSVLGLRSAYRLRGGAGDDSVGFPLAQDLP